MELNTVTLSDFVKNAEILFLKGLDSVSAAARNSGIFRVDMIPDHTGDTKEYTEIDLEEYAELKPEGDQNPRARVQQGYSKIGKLKRVGKDVGITYEMRHYNKYTDVVSRLTNLGRLPANRIELDLQHRIGFGASTSYVDKDGVTQDITVGDTKALFASDHEVKGSSVTYRNTLSGNAVFSKTALTAMEKMIIENSINQFGEKITIPYDIVWTTDNPDTVNTVREVLRSTADVTANMSSGVVNVYQGKYRHVILPLVATDNLGQPDTDKVKYWGLASSYNSQAFLGVNEEPRLKAPTGAGTSAEEFSTEDWNFGAVAGYFIVIPGARFISLSTGAGS
jgi:hypothetical protein